MGDFWFVVLCFLLCLRENGVLVCVFGLLSHCWCGCLLCVLWWVGGLYLHIGSWINTNILF